MTQNESSQENPVLNKGADGDREESVTPESIKDETEQGESLWLGRLINISSTVLIVVVVLIAYHFFYVVANKQKYAVVDITEVLNIKELQVTIAAMRPDASDEAKAKAYEEVAKFGKEIEETLNDLQQECGCSIFVKAAVVKAAGAEDLTPELKRRLGIENVNPADLVKQLRAVGGGSRSPIIEGMEK